MAQSVQEIVCTAVHTSRYSKSLLYVKLNHKNMFMSLILNLYAVSGATVDSRQPVLVRSQKVEM